ncbi:MAG: DUF3552 domain-containing protein, partial [Clostridia bacterium]|nr:DUF3552 domain-containing protein [Clostridia bacterium]
MPPILTVVFAAVAVVIAVVVGFFVGIAYRKKIGEAAIGSAEEKARNIINDAMKTAETKSKETLLEAKEDIHRSRTEAEKEIRDRRGELQRMEKRLVQKEELLDKREASYAAKEENLDRQMKKAEALEVQKIEIIEQQRKMLEQISSMTADQARAYLLETLQNDLKHESAAMIKDMETRTREEAENQAKELITRAIQKCASDHVSEATVSVVSLPNDEMKGRIIGREGRNIRALENLTGVDLIIDDTPETITLSSFDMVRREVARIALERLIQDGRIHPTRVGDMVEKARKEVDQVIKKEGERA